MYVAGVFLHQRLFLVFVSFWIKVSFPKICARTHLLGDTILNQEPIFVDLKTLCENPEQSGPQWGMASNDLNGTLLAWGANHTVGAHTNTELDVFLIVLKGEGEVRINQQTFCVSEGQALLIPKGTEREIQSKSSSFCYLNIHRRRAGLMPV